MEHYDERCGYENHDVEMGYPGQCSMCHQVAYPVIWPTSKLPFPTDEEIDAMFALAESDSINYRDAH